MSHRLAALAAALLAAATLSTEASAAGLVNPRWGKLVGFFVPLAGRDLNGTALNGSSLEGRFVSRVSLQGVELDGGLLSETWLSETRFYGEDARGKPVKRDKFVGATFQATLDDGSPIELYVNAIERHPDHANKDVYGYDLWYPTHQSWEPLCGRQDDGNPMYAIPLQGRWSYAQGTPQGGGWIHDPDAFTFACEGYVLAKCVTAGYKPWKELRECAPGEGCTRTNLANHHQACTRALRGDYLGDGTVHTTDGRPINMYDGLGLRFDSEDWTIEAEWDADGAVCVNQVRLPEYQSSIAALLYDPDCGNTSFFDDGTRLMTEIDLGS